MRAHGSRTRRGFLASVGVVATLAGCIATGRGETDTITETIDADEVDAVSASTENGEVTVTATENGAGEARVEKAAGTEGDLEAISVDAAIDDGVLTIDVEIDEDETAFLLGPGPKADLELSLPPSVALSGTRTANGDVQVSGVESDVDVETTNGDVSVEVEATDVIASTTNGDVEILVPTTFEATVSLSTTNGDLTLAGFEGIEDATADSSLARTIGDGTHEIEAETTNGDVEVRGR